VGRADHLRKIHRTLFDGVGGAAQVTARIVAGGGFGKTRLAIEYLHRYAPQYYKGGLFWVNGASKDREAEFWRILSNLNPTVPDLAMMRKAGRDTRRELEHALRDIRQPALYLIDDIPEAAFDEDPPDIAEFCPALGAVTVLATSRQDTSEDGVRTISLETLVPDAGILLLTENVPGISTLSWAKWARIAEWVGYLPLALDLLNRSLALGSIRASDLLRRATALEASGTTAELDRLRDAVRGQVPKDAVRGITQAFLISFEKLDDTARKTAMVLAQLAAAPIPEEFLEALPEELRTPAVRAAYVLGTW